MHGFILLLALISGICLMIGLFNPKSSLFWYKGRRTKKLSFLIYAVLPLFVAIRHGATAPPDFDYEVLTADRYGAVVLLKQDSITTEQLGHAADSLYYNGLHRHGDNFKVMYYYRRDYRDHICYAYKAWLYDIVKGKYTTDWDLDRYKSIDP